jgi:hypothetical protein
MFSPFFDVCGGLHHQFIWIQLLFLSILGVENRDAACLDRPGVAAVACEPIPGLTDFTFHDSSPFFRVSILGLYLYTIARGVPSFNII